MELRDSRVDFSLQGGQGGGPDRRSLLPGLGGDHRGPQRGLLRLAAPLVRNKAQKSVDADYDRLVQLLES